VAVNLQVEAFVALGGGGVCASLDELCGALREAVAR
jgi:hypothetical protein